MDKKVETSSSFLKGRGELFCRGCKSSELFSALDLGNLPIANELFLNKEFEVEEFPLHLRICKNCGLGQVADVVTPERIFRNYRYLSSMSSTFLTHAANYVSRIVEERFIGPRDWVLEIASNDGYLLKNFAMYGIKCVGIEPAENVAAISRKMGIETISEFFSSQLAKEILERYGFPKLIVANNVMAHVPDLLDFLQGLSILTGPDTKISIENPSMINILTDMQFDTIYHEHYSYLTSNSVDQIVQMFGLQLIEVEELPTHGGSNRYWIARQDPKIPIHPTVESSKNQENVSKIFDEKQWKNYAIKVEKIKSELETWLLNKKRDGSRVYGYGAAAKASTLLNSIDKESSSTIEAIADISLEKQQRFMPSLGHRIISMEGLIKLEITDILIFPWNIKAEIGSDLRKHVGSGVKLWCAIPEMHEIA